MTPAAARSYKTVEECTKPTDIYASCMHAKQVHNFTKIITSTRGWLGSRVVSVLDSGAEGPGSNRSRDAVG